MCLENLMSYGARAHVNMYLPEVLIALNFLNFTVYAYKLGDMKPAYVLAGHGAPGSCNPNQLEELQDSFREATTTTQQAILAIENLQKSPPLFNRNRRRTWKRQAQLLKALFNIDVDKSTGLGGGNEDANIVHCRSPITDGCILEGSDDTSRIPNDDRRH